MPDAGYNFDADRVPGSLILPTLAETTGRQPTVGIRKLIELASSGVLPMTLKNGRWGCRRADLPRIAEAIGMLDQKTAA